MDRALLEAFERCASETADEVGVATLVARLLDPEVSAGDVAQRLDLLAGRLPAAAAPWDFLRELGFRGNADDYSALANSNLAQVLESRRGIPITLGVVLIALARRAGRHAVGVNFPGHFLVQVDDVLVDPFEMRPADRDNLLARLPVEAQALPEGQIFAPAAAVTVGLRMLNNLKMVFSREADWSRTLDVVDAQLRLAPAQPTLHLERGELWRRLGLAEPARDAFQTALKLADGLPPDEGERVRQVAQAALDQLGGASDVVH